MPHKKDTKKRILDAAESLCATGAPSAVKHAEIARIVGVKPPSLYAHFKSIEAIILAVTVRALTDILDTFEPEDESQPAVKMLNDVQWRQLVLHNERPGIASLVLTDFTQPDGSHAVRSKLDLINAIVRKERVLFERAIREGSIPPSDFSFWHASRIGAFYTCLSYEWLDHPKIPPERLAGLNEYLAI